MSESEEGERESEGKEGKREYTGYQAMLLNFQLKKGLEM